MTRKYCLVTPSMIVANLEAQRLLFIQEGYELLQTQKNKSDQFLNLWQIPDRQSQRWVRNRARALLEIIYNKKSLGIEVFLLCALGTSTSRLARVDPVNCESQIAKWWATVEHPSSLAPVAKAYESRRWSVFSAFAR
ncbi:uncharacterized protein BO97DRAFT_279685 [Aspergillus homomorphus CBS 101889]|uniref:Uncharacterized protein n=1 Tax=Aspergillus homomorphus (strain CBS 101889) TaxID=1450537 RepID=A0A395I379_ASPHC|nr:hypothetical protein BO97DRAFT_279685 [Aspergillus homomorphus CBS 101889]RAL14195.1 hypothetical protein BO97DRAFT_279685 [Aspergillus homomorphus CBS 101889]